MTTVPMLGSVTVRRPSVPRRAARRLGLALLAWSRGRRELGRDEQLARRARSARLEVLLRQREVLAAALPRR